MTTTRSKRQFLSDEVIANRLQVWRSFGKSSNKAAEFLGVSRRTMDKFLDRYADDEKFVHVTSGFLEQTNTIKRPLPEKGQVKRYLLTSAQSNTAVHLRFLRNLEVFARRLDAELMVSGFTYHKNYFNTANEKKGSTKRENEILWTWAREIEPYMTSDLIELAPDLAWCANLQILPTAVNPLSGFQDYTGQYSSIIPHAKVAMEPVPTSKDRRTKHLYTTGTCTLLNYIKQKAGQKAEFHHSFAAMLVEVLPDGDWFARQLVADDEGTFRDAGTGLMVENGEIRELDRIQAVQWGDIHYANIDPVIEKMFWDKGGVLDTLRPRTQILHDLTDGESHNHHERNNHHKQFELHVKGLKDIRQEFTEAREFVDIIAHREWCDTLVAWSNHDEFIRKYLQYTDYRKDHVNATFILELELEVHKAIEEGRPAELFKTALGSDKATVLGDDNVSYEIEGIRVDCHGHVGASGSRGSVRQFAKMGAKTTTGHTHGAWWVGGATSAGTCSKLDLGYNKGFSTWSHSFVVIHEGGKRQIITANRETGRWRA